MSKEDGKKDPSLDRQIRAWLESDDGQRFEASQGAMSDEYKNAMYDAIRKSAPELKPCPFCGGKARAYKYAGEEWVGCQICCIRTPMKELEKAIADWNRRVEE